MVAVHQQEENSPERRHKYKEYLMRQQPHQTEEYCAEYVRAFTAIAHEVNQLPSIRLANGHNSLYRVVETAFSGVPPSRQTSSVLCISDTMEVAREDVVFVAQYVSAA